jgi:hypothetical protein
MHWLFWSIRVHTKLTKNSQHTVSLIQTVSTHANRKRDFACCVGELWQEPWRRGFDEILFQNHTRTQEKLFLCENQVLLLFLKSFFLAFKRTTSTQTRAKRNMLRVVCMNH